MQNENSKFIVRIETCVDCGDEFIINLEEFIKKTESGMRLPKRCVACRKKRRSVCRLAFNVGKISSN